MGPTPNFPFVLSSLDDRLPELGFFLASGGSYSKVYRIPDGSISLDVLCGPDQVFDVVGTIRLASPRRITRELIRGEGVFSSNVGAISALSMVRTAASMGMPGGSGGMHNLNLPTDYPGPRWWPADLQKQDIDELSGWIQKQYRYNPEYMAIGDAMSSGDDRQHHVATLPPGVSYARLIRDRQEPMIEFTTSDGRVGHRPITGGAIGASGGIGSGEVAQEMDKYDLSLQPTDGGTAVYLKKQDTRGDQKGIWQINGPSSQPGFGYVWEDWRTGYSLHPELLDDKQWAAGQWSPGTQRWQSFNR